MQLQELTEKVIQQFAGTTIFNRGYDYYQDGMVSNLQYDSETESIQAEVAGSYGDYDVSITTQSGSLSADCTCPYEGYPCKHVVATLLTFIHHKHEYFQQAETRKKSESSLAKKVKALSKDELVEILLSCSKKYSDVRRDLQVRLESDKKATFSTIHKQIMRAFPSIQSHSYSTHSIAKELTTILKSVENSTSEMQIKVCWAVIDRTLKELNEYGMDDEVLENVAIDAMESLVEAFQTNASLQEEKAEIIEQLLIYYEKGNFGITDWVYDTVLGLCTEKSDYMIVIDFLERRLTHTSFRSYYQKQLAYLYEAIGDTDAQRSTLEKHLQYGMDYWHLAQYWFGQGNEEQALEVIKEGVEKGEGRKTELYEALQKHYQQQNDYARIVELLEQKIVNHALDNQGNLRHDSAYQCLWEYYTSQHDYQGQKNLLEMCLDSKDIDLEFYKQAEEILTVSDWQEFAPKIIRTLNDRIQQEPSQSYYIRFPYIAMTKSVVKTLAEIYAYTRNTPMLYETVKNNIKLLSEYESQLLPEYATDYIQQYRHHIDRLIAARGREKYKAAVPYAKTIKHIYANILKTPDEWTRYITNLRQVHKTLRAFQQEFAGL